MGKCRFINSAFLRFACKHEISVSSFPASQEASTLGLPDDVKLGYVHPLASGTRVTGTRSDQAAWHTFVIRSRTKSLPGYKAIENHAVPQVPIGPRPFGLPATSCPQQATLARHHQYGLQRRQLHK